MGAAAASAFSPPPEAAALADPPANKEIKHSVAADAAPEATAPPEAAAPADSPEKEEIQSAAPPTPPADAPGGDAEAPGETVVLDAAAEAGEEEVGECGFCLYMKGGGCKDEFVEWEKCVESVEAKDGDIVELCAKATTALRRCMDNFPDYYEPILKVEKAMSDDLVAAKEEEEAAKAEAEASGSSDPSPASPPAAVEGGQEDNKKQAEEEWVVVVDEKEDPAA